MPDRLLEAGGQGHDAEQDSVVPVAKSVDRERRASLRWGIAKRTSDRLLIAEVHPPEGGAQAQGEQRHEHEASVHREPGSSGTDDDDRFAERDDHDEPMALDEVLHGDHEALDGRKAGSRPEQRDGEPHRAHCASPPSAPPTSTSETPAELNGRMRRIPRTSEVDVR